jgi:hypothetical protein
MEHVRRRAHHRGRYPNLILRRPVTPGIYTAMVMLSQGDNCPSFTLLAGAHRPVRSPSVNRFACNRATANPRRLQAQDSTIVLFKFARPALFEARKMKHANCHPLTVVNLSSEPWFAATAAGQSERRSSITPGTSLNSGGAQVAQLVEHVTENHGVGGSIPPLGTKQPQNV